MGPAQFAIGLPVTGNFESYRKAKLKILEKDCCIKLTQEDREHANSLKTEIEVDNFFISAIRKYWD